MKLPGLIQLKQHYAVTPCDVACLIEELLDGSRSTETVSLFAFLWRTVKPISPVIERIQGDFVRDAAVLLSNPPTPGDVIWERRHVLQLVQLLEPAEALALDLLGPDELDAVPLALDEISSFTVALADSWLDLGIISEKSAVLVRMIAAFNEGALDARTNFFAFVETLERDDLDHLQDVVNHIVYKSPPIQEQKS